MNSIKLAIIIFLTILTVLLLNRDSKKGFSLSIFFLILMPRELFFELGGSLPTITGYRAIVLVLIFQYFFIEKWNKYDQRIPILNLLKLVLLTKFISLWFAFDFSQALNGFIVFFLEIVVFYVILFRAIRDREALDAVMMSITLAVIVIAVMGVIEKYTQFNPVDYISESGEARFDPRNAYTVYSAFSHPILFGTALAMGWPICQCLMDRQNSTGKKKFLWVSIIAIYASLYFSNSRGPWLGFIIAAMLLLILGYPNIHRKAMFIVMATTLVLILRPGVYENIHGLSVATFDDSRAEGGSFYYRLELYKKAYNEIRKSPIRFVFGYGDGAAQAMELRGEVSYGSGREHRFWSWDSQFAVILLHGGFVGLISNLILYFSTLYYLIKCRKAVSAEDRSIIVALISSISVLVFMMTNVAIFSPQLHFIMWTSVAIGIILANKEFQNRGRYLEAHHPN
jgi:hypothetical protein